MADPVSAVISAIVYVGNAFAAVATGTATIWQTVTVLAVTTGLQHPSELRPAPDRLATRWSPEDHP